MSTLSESAGVCPDAACGPDSSSRPSNQSSKSKLSSVLSSEESESSVAEPSPHAPGSSSCGPRMSSSTGELLGF
ncbi:hypothetical protein PGT21_024922 [Puccinia graminis f. sp. tritici]|uniref:Uncharacterized protein n=1 Tax=Puccinia graminis f. sp. tritici TaxID=56615 RepID=A0A5B0NNF5_PUCGR|nr:hypothetical protein PGT21_024922 [Puccinia graminis f. sp. tritici]KAA1123897.1 hypothetical protein PGTUg99_028915 [Puccinia graminis f. sp. tritici]